MKKKKQICGENVETQYGDFEMELGKWNKC